MNQAEQYAQKTARGALLSHLYILQEEGLNDFVEPRRASRLAIQSLGARGMLPPHELLLSSLRWLQGAGYVDVDWAMDDHSEFESVAITQGGIDLYEHKDARKLAPGLTLPPRR